MTAGFCVGSVLTRRSVPECRKRKGSIKNFPLVSCSTSYSDLLKKQTHSFFDYANSVCILLFIPSVNKRK